MRALTWVTEHDRVIREEKLDACDDNSRVYQARGKYIDTRNWDAEFNHWNLDRKNHPKPGKHPDPAHLWNTKPELYVLDNVGEDY